MMGLVPVESQRWGQVGWSSGYDALPLYESIASKLRGWRA
jgi:hypothetical protein